MVNLNDLAVEVISIQKQIKVVLEKLEVVEWKPPPNFRHHSKRWIANRENALTAGREALSRMAVLEDCLKTLRLLRDTNHSRGFN